MLLDNGGTERDASHRYPHTHGMVGQTNLTAEQFAQVRDRGDVGIHWRGGVGTCALQQDQVATAGFASSAHSLIQLGDRGHAGRNNHRLASCRDAPDQRQIGVLEGRDLEAGDVQRLEEVDRISVEGRTESDDPELTCPLEDRGVPLEGRAGLSIQIVQARTLPQAFRI